MSPQMCLPQQSMQQVSHAMGPYRPGVSTPMVRNANMSSMTSPRLQSGARDEMGEYEETQRDLRP